MRLIFSLFALLFMLSFIPSQETGKIEERVEVHLVVVPVVVLDKKGNFVEGLKKEDFEIFEDGERQEISSFYVQRFSNGKIKMEGIEGGERVEKEVLGGRTIVIIFDQMITNPFYVSRLKEPLENFLKNFLRKEDRLAVFIGSKSYIWWGGNFFSSSSDPVGEIIKKAMLGIFVKDLKEGYKGSSELDFSAIAYEMIFFQSLKRLMDIADGLKRIEGEKIVILLSEGYGSIFSPRSRHRELQDPSVLAKFFNDSNTVVYSVNIEGLKSDVTVESFKSISEREKYTESLTLLTFNQLYLRQLSHETGGVAITNTNDLNEGLQLIGKAMNKSYVLGYTPKNKVMDGKYRKIEVKVKRKGLEVRHRRGYFASDWKEDQFKELGKFLKKGKRSEGGLKLSLENIEISGSFCQVFTIEPSGLSISSLIWEEGGKEDKIYLSRFLIMGILEKNGILKDKFKEEVILALKEDELKKKFSLYFGKELEEGRYKLKVAIEDKNTGVMSAEEKEVEIPKLEKGEEGIGVLFFVNEKDIIRQLGEGICFPEIEGRKIYPGRKKEFTKKEMLPIYFDYFSKEGGDAVVGFNIYRDGERVKVIKTRMNLQKGKNLSYTSIPLSDFQKGEYTLEVVVEESDKGVEQRKIEKFRVIE